MSITPHMLHIMHHTLGLRPDHRNPYRNYYVAGPLHSELPNLIELEQAGLMRRASTPAFCNQSDMVFVCTDTGQAYAIENLPPEPKRTKYGEFCRVGDCFDSFAHFLGINKPKYETRWNDIEECFVHRMYRRDMSVSWAVYHDISGDWMPTKKAAKESYKAALKKRKGGK